MVTISEAYTVALIGQMANGLHCLPRYTEGHISQLPLQLSGDHVAEFWLMG
jgi:hypothetical protein